MSENILCYQEENTPFSYGKYWFSEAADSFAAIGSLWSCQLSPVGSSWAVGLKQCVDIINTVD